MSSDPFEALGLDTSATADDVRAARRTLAKAAHPDVGGDAAVMRVINDAAAAALRAIADRTTTALRSRPEPVAADPRAGEGRRRRDAGDEWADDRRRDAPSFTIDALPVESFEALLVAAAALGEVVDDDPPYGLDVVMSAPLRCWCHLSVVPDAGSSTVSLAVAAAPDVGPPSVETVRDAWIAELNHLDWSSLDT